jgi:hypothetical protein
MKDNLIEKVLLVVILFLLANNSLQQCQLKKDQLKLVEQQLANSDSTKAQIDRMINARRDSIIKENNFIREVVKYKERAQNEVIKTNDLDSLILLYWRHRANNPPD